MRLCVSAALLLVLVSACSNSWDIEDSPSVEATEKTCGLAREAAYIGSVLANDAYKTSNIVFRWGDIWTLAAVSATDAHPELNRATLVIAEYLSDRGTHSDKEHSDASARVYQMCLDFELWDLPKESLADGVPIFDLDNNWKP
jgi:hypothetical protein